MPSTLRLHRSRSLKPNLDKKFPSICFFFLLFSIFLNTLIIKPVLHVIYYRPPGPLKVSQQLFQPALNINAVIIYH